MSRIPAAAHAAVGSYARPSRGKEAPRYLIHNRDHAFERLKTTAKAMDADATPPIAPGHARQVAVRREALTLACFDRV